MVCTSRFYTTQLMDYFFFSFRSNSINCWLDKTFYYCSQCAINFNLCAIIQLRAYIIEKCSKQNDQIYGQNDYNKIETPSKLCKSDLKIQITLFMNKMNFNGEGLHTISQNNQNSYPNAPVSKLKKPKSSSNQLELHVASTYQDIYEMVSQKTQQASLPQEVSTALERINLLKSLIQFLLDNSLNNNHATKQQKQDKQNDEQFQCNQCASYQANLQKLENQVRQHIRTQQQLKLYTDNIEDKLQDAKKEKKDIEKKIDTQKRQIEEMKYFSSTNIEKMNKLELQNEKLKNQIKVSKTSRGDQTRRTKGGIQNKQNRIDWGHRNVSIKKQQKQETRRSVQKRPQSNQKYRNSVNTRSTKGFSMAEKLIQEKNKQERKKLLQSKFEYRK